jgi:hypothetical protein
MSATGLEVFDKSIQTTNIWLDEIMEDMGPDRQLAWHLLGACSRPQETQSAPRRLWHGVASGFGEFEQRNPQIASLRPKGATRCSHGPLGQPTLRTDDTRCVVFQSSPIRGSPMAD